MASAFWATLVGCFLALAVACGDDTPTPAAPLSVTPASSEWGPPPEEVQVQLSRCLEDVSPDPIDLAAEEVQSCLDGPGKVPVLGVDGEVPVILADVPSTVSNGQFIAWWETDRWSTQHLGPLPDGGLGYRLVDNRTMLASNMRPVESSARELAEPSGVRLGVIHGVGTGTSGGDNSFMVLGLEEGSWQILWDAQRQREISRLSHVGVEFGGAGLDQIEVIGSSWFLEDPLSRTFYESNSGPHRWLEQTWVRDSDGYSLVSERPIPSAYNTLVEFVYQLRSGEDVAAKAFLNSPDLLQTARDLGLAEPFPVDPEDRWYGWCTDNNPPPVHPRPEEPPCHIEFKDGSRLVVEMVASGLDWLISAIEPCPAGSNCR